MFKKINFFISSLIPQKLYWHLAGLIHPWEGVLEGVNNPKLLYQQSEGITLLLKKLKLISKKTSVLDIGCGVGRIEYALNKHVYKCIGIDIAPSMIKLAQKNVKAKNVEFLVTNGKDLKAVKDQKFDLVFSIIVFQHLPRKIFLNYLKEAGVVLNKGGKIFFQIPIYWQQKPKEPPENHPWALRFYQTKELQKSLEKLNFKEVQFLDVGGNKLKGAKKQAFVLATK
ncbi:class I SAM-dependent methyltransferase [Patescibacteria group bacterium]|nr:class I SAM-dependent methyltransferase [Patescibacteria group bacterium]